MGKADVFDLQNRGIPYQFEYQYAPGTVQGHVCDIIPAGSRVLEVGCGGGGMGLLLSKRLDCEVVGVEPDSGAADLARSRGLHVECSTLEEFAEKSSDQFDVILLLDVLEHLYDPRKALEALPALLNREGTMILSVPNVAFWSVRLNLLFGRFDYTYNSIMDYTHIRWFTRKSLRQVLELSGLRIVSERYSIGGWLDCYRWIPRPFRRFSLSILAQLLPGLFAFQLVVETRPR